MKKIFSMFLICLFLVGCNSSSYETIVTNQALELIDDGAKIVDVRTPEEYARERIPNAVNIPLDIIDTIDLDKDEVIIVYCQSGMRSKEAAQKLIDMGYTAVYNLDGGLLNWGETLEE